MNQFVGGAALMGVIAAFWTYLRTLAWRLINLVIVKARMDGELGDALGGYCWQKLSRWPFGERLFHSSRFYVRPIDRYQTVGYETVGYDSLIFWKGWRPLWISMGTPSITGDAGGRHSPGVQMSVSFIRGTFNLDELFIASLDQLNAAHHNGELAGRRYQVVKLYGHGVGRRASRDDTAAISPGGSPKAYEEATPTNNTLDRRYLKWEKDELGLPLIKGNPLESLYFPPETQEVMTYCRRWFSSEEWYRKKSIPWRLGVLLYGKPGTGKTSLVRALGQSMDVPIFAFDLASHDNRTFEMHWDKMLGNTPCIALLEDVDAVFDGRENTLGDQGGGLTFDCLLNCLGGIKDASGVLLCVTTNHVEKLDPALGCPDAHGISSRPGRIDVATELGLMSEDCRRQMARSILDDYPHMIEPTVKAGHEDTGAQFQERCAKIALDLYWSGHELNGYAKPRTLVKEASCPVLSKR